MAKVTSRPGTVGDWAAPPPTIWEVALDAALEQLGSTPTGLTSDEAAVRLARVGQNTSHARQPTGALALLARQFASPIILILVAATVLSGVLGDFTDAVIILSIVVLSGLLGFWQERSANRAVDDLMAMVRVNAEVLRDGAMTEVPVDAVLPGDVVQLNAGDVIPGDCRVMESRTLLVDESSLSGEAYPVTKSPGRTGAGVSIGQRRNALFMGTHVVSGSGTAVVVRTGSTTEFGRVAERLASAPVETSFERGMTAFGLLLVRAMVVLVVTIFVVNIVLSRPLIDSALFSLALAVGLTPQLLPAIVTISLSQGARRMAQRRVIVKRLDAIEDFGSMSVLCTDKTGTMTVGSVSLADTLGTDGQPSPGVRTLAALNGRLQTGFTNPIDDAIAAATDPAVVTGAERLDELPYDFTRKRLSVLVRQGGATSIVTKGAFEGVVSICSHAELPDGGLVDIASVRDDLANRYRSLSAQGFRVLGVASRATDGTTNLAPSDETNLVFRGFATFSDPPKPDADATIRELANAGVSVRMVTGDNRLAAAHVGGLVGLDAHALLSGSEIDAMDDATLTERVRDTAIFAEVEPMTKERIIVALRRAGFTVGYLGDGINDAPALHAADVGISVDTAVDVAKQAAAIVLLEKDLRVLLQGVRQGRQTFTNTIKYIFTTTSANFGNMISMALASVVLPFLPLLAGQILLINFLSDIPGTTIATDSVDPEQLDRPPRWDLGFVRSSMLVFGGVSSVFDLLTFAVLRIGFQADATLFRSAWFVESVATELAVLFVLRTRRAFFRSRPSRLLVASSVFMGVVTVAIPFSPLAVPLGLGPLPPQVLAVLTAVTLLYVVATELAKVAFYRVTTPARIHP